MTDTACLARRCGDKIYYKEDSSHHYYLETRCRDEVLPGTDLCAKCEKRRLDPNNEKGKGYTGKPLWWGRVTEPLENIIKGEKTQKNQIAGSPDFLEKIKIHGISPENLQKARDAHARAVAGLNEVAPFPDIGEMAPKKKEKKIKGVKVVAALPSTAATVPEPVVVAPPPVPAKRRQKKTVEAPIAIISEEKPEEVDVEIIHVITKELDGTRYYVDTSKSKVYDIKTSKYIGPWDTVTEKLITTIPDSDAEC